MLRSVTAAIAIIAIVTPAYALDMSGDFDCVAYVPDADTAVCAMRIGPDNTYGFLTSDAVVSDWHHLKYSDNNAVRFAAGFAEQSATGSTLVEAAVQPDECSFTATLQTADGKSVAVYCPSIP